MLKRDQLTEEVEGEKELEVKELGEELAGTLRLGHGHNAAEEFFWWSEVAGHAFY